MTQRTQGLFTLHAIFQIIPSSFQRRPEWRFRIF